MSLDARLTLARPDLARVELEGVVRAEAFAQTEARQVVVPVAPLRRAPDAAAEQDDQLLFGELFDVLEMNDGFAWGQARRDGYVGFVAEAALGERGAVATHRVRALRTYAFATPEIRAPAFGPLSMNALVSVEEERGAFAHVAGTGWIPRTHLATFHEFESDPVAVAERFLGAPYLWGGRDSLGIDCSGLVQQALYACGLACPRDNDQQAALGADVAPERLARGDLVFWTDHVGLMADAERLLHANAHRMAVTVEPLADAIARAGPPTSYRRL
ncbi:MAG TPA: NlpC/P60 family protein [Caulobacteraceae bacterium]|nr:NlpC/P60 family protein [Caulobacteraceae bacterium]